MHKDELIQMHTLLCQIKNHLEAQNVGGGELFGQYRSLSVSPIHVHRSKGEHKKAIFVLGKEIAEALSTGDHSGPAKLTNRFSGLLSRLDKTPMPIRAF